MTIDEKVNALSTNLGVPRLGIRNTGHSEGLHGMALGGPGNWGGAGVRGGMPQTYPTTIFPTKYAGKREHFSPFRSNVDIHSPVTSLEGRLFGEKQTQSGTTTEHLGQTKKDFISPTNGDRIEHLSTRPHRFETSVMARFVRTGVAVGCGAHAACCARSGRKKNGTRCACHRDCVQSEITLERPRDNFMCPSALDDPHPRW